MISNPLKSKNSTLSRQTAFTLAILASTTWTPVAHGSEFPAIIPLSSLDGAIGFRLDGVAADDMSGRFNLGVDTGDFNGDGFADVIVGASGADTGAANSGASYVVFGKPSGFPAAFDLSALDGTNGFRLDGVAADDRSGFSAASAGDINGDGFTDMIIGAPNADPNGLSSGSAYVVFGKTSGFAASMALSSLNGTNGFRVDGLAANDRFGFNAVGVGDVNGDGFTDMIIGAPNADPNGTNSGSTYTLFGKATAFPAAFNVSSLNGSNGFRLDGVAADDSSGLALAGAGDVNSDGFDDVIVGARGADPHGESSGSSYVVFGKASGFAATTNLSSLDGTNGFRLDGTAVEDRSGDAVGGGDVNGDGFADVIIGARDADPNGLGAEGATYVLFGKASGFAPVIDLSALNGANGFRLDGTASLDKVGYAVDATSDVNGDGFADVITSAEYASRTGTFSGSSFVVFGKATGFAATIDLSTLIGTNGFRLDGAAAGDFSGDAVASGDVNGDGFGDVIIGAPYADPHGSRSGSTYVVFGRAPDSARTRIGAAAKQYISGGAFADTLKGLGGNDALEGRGGADTIVGGASNDTASYLHAAAGVRASLAYPAVNTGSAKGDSYTTIENLTGSRFADVLIGNGFANRITGAEGRDVLLGLGGADLLVFNSTRDSVVGAARDWILDFNAGGVGSFFDRIDLSAIDAETGPGNQAFTYIGAAAFTNTKGQLRVQQAGAAAIVMGDVDGDAAADFEIGLLNFPHRSALTAIDFRL